MNKLLFIARLLFAIMLPVLLLATNIWWAAGSPRLYTYGFEKYGVSAASGIAEDELESVAESLVDYFSNDDELWLHAVYRDGSQVQLLSDREAEHFRDVKRLIQLDRLLRVIALVYVLGFVLVARLWRGRAGLKEIGLALLWGSGLTLALMAAMGLALAFGFDRFFLGFHQAFFPNDLWIARFGDIMTVLFPEGFFFDAAVFIAVATVVEAGALLGTGWLARRRGIPPTLLYAV